MAIYEGTIIQLRALFPVPPTDPVELAKFLKKKFGYNTATGQIIDLKSKLPVTGANPSLVELSIQLPDGTLQDVTSSVENPDTGVFTYNLDSDNRVGEIVYKWQTENTSIEGTLEIVTLIAND